MYSKHSLADWLDDRIVYRNLVPADCALPSLKNVWRDVGLDVYRVPRKTEPVYSAAVFEFLQAAQAQRGGLPLRQLLFIGDTRMNDGTAARNLATHLPLRGFIGSDRLGEPEQVDYDGPLMIANRWQRLMDFVDWAQGEGMACDEQTAVLIDIDKTFVGARGRNDRVIDAARVAAVRKTVEELLGGGFDEERFRAVYDELNQQRHHHFTADNQDYLAYICLMVVGDIFPANELWSELNEKRLSGFTQFVTLCDGRRKKMNEGLDLAHREVVTNVRRGDPTPFKSFRYREYFTTVERMNRLPDDSSGKDLLEGEILITEEVTQVAQQLSELGVLTFGISDKPDEASLPPNSLAKEGWQPIHRVQMKVVGGLTG